VSFVSSADASVASPTIACTVHAPATVKSGQPVPLTVALHNRGATRVAVLNWGTTFEEAWLQPFITVMRDGKALQYGGALVKRGDPELDEYFSLEPGEQREAALDLGEVYSLTEPGRYTIVPHIVLHDVAPGSAKVPRSRANHAPVTLACKPVTITIR
jgi:peptidyl-Lys metalloendopeptidase